MAPNSTIQVDMNESHVYEDGSWEKNPYAASPESVYDHYNVKVDHDHGDRAQEIKLCSCVRPHMRGLHCAWISFFLAFMIWFAVAPLLGEIQNDLGLTKQQIWSSSIARYVLSENRGISRGFNTCTTAIPLAFANIPSYPPTVTLPLSLCEC